MTVWRIPDSIWTREALGPTAQTGFNIEGNRILIGNRGEADWFEFAVKTDANAGSDRITVPGLEAGKLATTITFNPGQIISVMARIPGYKQALWNPTMPGTAEIFASTKD